MDGSSITMILVLAFLIMMSAYFSATETAYSTVNKIRLKNGAAEGNKRARLVLRQLEDYDKLLSTILIGNNIVNIASASLATVLFTKYFGEPGVTISTVVMTVLVLIFGEISPKSLAKESPERFAMFSAPFLKFFCAILAPLNFLFRGWKKLLSKLFKGQESQGITEDELITIVEEAESEGGIDAHEGELIRSAIEFNDLKAEDIFTPRVDIVAVDKADSMGKIAKTFDENNFSRLLVYDDTVDNIVGVIHEKDFYALMREGRSQIDPAVKDVVYANPTMKISTLLRNLQQSSTHMAVVVDEYGGTEGIVTMEDIIEELVGEIWDEHDEVIQFFREGEDGSLYISCNADVEDMCERLNLPFTDEMEACSSVSGWVVQELGKIPEVGDSFDYQNLRITVVKTDFRRVVEIRAELMPSEQAVV